MRRYFLYRLMKDKFMCLVLKKILIKDVCKRLRSFITVMHSCKFEL
jgi:hypothetical protein